MNENNNRDKSVILEFRKYLNWFLFQGITYFQANSSKNGNVLKGNTIGVDFEIFGISGITKWESYPK